jgi:flavodoxin
MLTFCIFWVARATKINSRSSLMGIMKTAVFYLSRTGNTKRFAETISESLKVPLFDITAFQPASATDYDLLIIGTPVTGFKAAPEVLSFVQKLPEGVNKKTILFCTYALAKGTTFKNLEQELSKKGYKTLLTVSKRGVKPNQTDFLDVVGEITKCVEV